MPNDFFEYQADYNPVSGQDQQVVDYFSAHNITLYKSTWIFNITFSYGDTMEALEDVPTTDHQIEFHAQKDIWGDTTLHLRHAYPSWFFGLWLEYHYMFNTPFIQEQLRVAGHSNFLIIDWEAIEILAIDANASSFEVTCDHLTMNFVVMNTGDYATLEDSWNNDIISVLSSYEIDFDAMKPSAFTLITQLITFQNPDFGIPGIFGEIVNYIFGIGFWIVIAITIYTIVTKLIPTIQGGIEN